MKQYRIITNNPKIKECLPPETAIHFLNGTYEDVLLAAENLIRQGYTLLSHPLSGSIKPNETPYKSILISPSKKATPDWDSLYLIRQALNTYYKFAEYHIPSKDTPWDTDFRLLDFTLIESALQSVEL